jgi:hypothetical protein
MPTDNRNGKVINIAMFLAQKSGYDVEAWRLFEREAETTLARMSQRSPSIQPDLADVEAREHADVTR